LKQSSRFIHKLKEEGVGKDSGLSIIILSSSPGYRMKGFGPKCLIKDRRGNSILEHQVDLLQTEFNQHEIIVVGGFEIDKLVKNLPKNVRLVENQLYETSNEICDVRLGINNALFDNVLIISGDIYFNSTVIQNITKESTLVLDKYDNMLADDIGVTIADNKVTIMSMSISKPKWCKIVYLADKELRLLKQFVNNRDNDKLFLFEGLNYVLDKSGEFGTKFITKNETLVHIDSTKELEKIT
jgi:choline kinase